MIFEIEHKIEYTYNKPVFQEPCKIYLIPRSDGYQHRLDCSAHISPSPQMGGLNTDLNGNTCYEAVFGTMTDRFVITVKSRAEALKKNPFDYFIDPGHLTLPIKSGKRNSKLLQYYLETDGISSEVKAWFYPILEASETKTADFLFNLTGAMHKTFSVQNRPDEGVFSPERTFSAKAGSCRDLSVLMIHILRSLNLPARFVSGYYEADPAEKEKDLHAWVEAYIEGAGWRGYDPSNGIAVQDRHVALASSADPGEIFPVMGSYRGDDATSEMRHQVTMAALI